MAKRELWVIEFEDEDGWRPATGTYFFRERAEESISGYDESWRVVRYIPAPEAKSGKR